MRPSIAFLALLAGCPGKPTPSETGTPTGSTGLGPGECRTAADCPDDPDCIEPDWDMGCGEYTGTVSPPCTVEGDPCPGTGLVCEATLGSCGQWHYACQAACAGDSACAADERCRPSGACTPTSCADGEVACAADEVCDPSAGDLHGCAHAACADDADCGDLTCVNGRCFATPGACGQKLYPP
jgi:hypothetical protein